MRIKDYLHLYLGCEMQRIDESGVFVLTHHTLSQIMLPGTSEDIKTAKPILRKLDSMTEDEADHLSWVFPLTYPKSFIMNLEADEIPYLLKQGFDLFGLIDAGLAIDAATINQPVKNIQP